MSELVVEYLYFAKKELPEEISKVFKKSISPYVVDSQLKCEFQGENLMCNYDAVPYNDSLQVVFKYKKSGKIALKEVQVFQETLKKINIESSKSRLKHTTLLDTSSLFLSKKLLPYLHKYEWSMRKLIYLVAPTYFRENWITDSIAEKKINRLKEKAKGEWNPDNLLQWMDLSDFEEYLFGENYIQINGKDEENVLKVKEISAKELLSLLQEGNYSISKEYSLWEEIFDKYMNVESNEIQNDMKIIREGRNTVGHNKELTVPLYQELLKKLKKYIRHLDNAFQKIQVGDIGKEVLDIMADDFNGYIKYQLSSEKLNAMNQASDKLGSMMSFDASAMESIMKNTVSNLQGFNTSAIESIMESATSNLQGFNTSAMGSIAKSAASNLQGFNTSAIESIMESITSNLQGFNTSAMGSIAKSAASNLQGFNTSAMESIMESITSNLQGFNTSAMGSIAKSAASNLQGFNTSAIESIMESASSNLQGFNTSAMESIVESATSNSQWLNTNGGKQNLDNFDEEEKDSD